VPVGGYAAPIYATPPYVNQSLTPIQSPKTATESISLRAMIKEERITEVTRSWLLRVFWKTQWVFLCLQQEKRTTICRAGYRNPAEKQLPKYPTRQRLPLYFHNTICRPFL